jgi:large conductance mechanosensitive channel
MLKEFKEFALRGNVLDLAVGVIIGGAFGKIVASLVSDIFMPLIGLFMGGINFTDLTIHLGSAQIKYGAFIQTVVDFLVIAGVVFLIIKAANAAQKLTPILPPAEPATRECPHCFSVINIKATRCPHCTSQLLR